MPTLIDGEALLMNSEGSMVPSFVAVTLHDLDEEDAVFNLGSSKVVVSPQVTSATVFNIANDVVSREVVGKNSLTISGTGGRITISHRR